MLEGDPALRRLEQRARWLKYPVVASLVLVAAAIALTAIADLSWLWLLFGAALAWFVFARLAVVTWRELHLTDYEWRLDHADTRERNLLHLAQRAIWPWGQEVADEATHAVVVAEEIGGQLEVESFGPYAEAEKRLDERTDMLGGERRPVVVALVELDAESDQAVIEVVGGRTEGRRALTSLPLAQDGWLVGL